MKLDSTDFSKKERSNHLDKNDIVYIFGKKVLLRDKISSKEGDVDIYVKMAIDVNSKLVVISFHEQEYPLKYVFK